MRRIYYMMCALLIAISLLAMDAYCQSEQPAQTADRKGLIFRLVDAVKNMPMFKKKTSADAVPGVKPVEKVAGPATAPQVPKASIPAEMKELPPEEEKVRAEMETQQKKTRATMTKEELIQDIEDTLDGEEEVLDYIPQLKKLVSPDGKTSYAYEGSALRELERDLLDKIFVRVNQTATRITTERMQSQLETIRQVENLQRMQNLRTGPPYVPPTVPQTPPQAVTQPPQVPQTPPRIPPSPPPQPPDTRR